MWFRIRGLFLPAYQNILLFTCGPPYFAELKSWIFLLQILQLFTRNLWEDYFFHSFVISWNSFTFFSF